MLKRDCLPAWVSTALCLYSARPSGVACVYVNMRGAVSLVYVFVDLTSVWLNINTEVAVVLRGVCVSAC